MTLQRQPRIKGRSITKGSPLDTVAIEMNRLIAQHRDSHIALLLLLRRNGGTAVFSPTEMSGLDPEQVIRTWINPDGSVTMTTVED